MRNDETGKKDCSRRNFLQAVGAGVPTLKLMLDGVAGAAPPAVRPEPPFDSNKFTPLDISRHATATARDFGAREQARGLLGCEQDGLVRTLAGEQKLRGIPFLLAPEGPETKRWTALSTRPSPWAVSNVEISLPKRAAFVCVGAFCDWDRDDFPASGQEQVERIGQQLGEALLVYEDGGERMFPIRRRFEVNSPSVEWGHQCYAALPHVREAPRKLHEALPDATMWGHVQLGVGDDLPPDQSPPAFIWVWPLSNPEPERNLRALRLKATSEEPLMVCGVTLYHGKENPLRLAPLHVYRITVPEPTASEPGRWSLGVDLGVVARSYTLNDFDAESWLAAPGKGLGERRRPTRSRYLYADIAANAGATLTLTDTKNGGQFQFDLGQAALGQEVAARAGAAHIEILDPHKVWLHGRAVDSATGKPTPVRLAFRTAQGRYIPPYGHRTEINNAWFQDYGADLMMMDTPFAYVDGTFQVELPVGEIFVEMTKGFEYSPVRRKVQIAPRQRELKLEIARFADLRKEGWITADTHVHFLSPSTAVLEGQAEGLNLINLLAAQWGDLFTNVGTCRKGRSPHTTGRPWCGPARKTRTAPTKSPCSARPTPRLTQARRNLLDRAGAASA